MPGYLDEFNNYTDDLEPLMSIRVLYIKDYENHLTNKNAKGR